MQWIVDVARIAAPIAVGFATGYLAAERNDKRSERSVEAALFAAGALKKVCVNLANTASASPNWTQPIAQAYTQDRGIDVIRSVLVHVRAVDLPDSIAIDSLATTNLLLARTERVLTAASGSSVSAPSFVSDLLDIAKELDEQIMLYHSAMNQLTRSMWRKMLSRADPRHWWRKRGV
ncbi:MAG: hypothetical protein KYX67_15115 [Brevundimonas sp.]|uniref:Uncharacterized protein n=1 Tax=Brevundimonas mediterranea TaxID=74329 RepID=A0A7W6A2V2_9CAUL|nr:MULTISPECIES: hypothetical protein [Brevundimonas]MBB3872266.1 hypothetical protein [Brevundimonas mediterranea]MDK2748647.1 hypothetical protein [Brevundimonas sp.]